MKFGKSVSMAILLSLYIVVSSYMIELTFELWVLDLLVFGTVIILLTLAYENRPEV